MLQALRGADRTLLIDMEDPAVALPPVQVVAASASGTAVPWCGDPEAMRLIRQADPDAAIWTPWYSTVPPQPSELDGVSMGNAQHLLVGAAFVEAVHGQGAEVAVWTVDDAAQAAHLAAIGVDSITSNRVPAIRQAVSPGTLDERPRQAAIALEIGEHAAEMTARARRDGIQTVETKTGPADHVTEVDRGIERWVRAAIDAQFPDHDMVGEEYGGDEHGDRPCWYLHPVDGTANLANGFPWTSFSLALVERGRPVVGVVFDPVGGSKDGAAAPVPVLAVQGRGTWRLGARLTTAPTAGEDPLSGALVVTELDGALMWDGMYSLMDVLGARACTVRIPGSGTASLSGIAMGRGVAAIIHRYSPLDHAAAALVVLEAGGVVLDGEGHPHPHPVGSAIIAAADERSAQALWAQWRKVVGARQ